MFVCIILVIFSICAPINGQVSTLTIPLNKTLTENDRELYSSIVTIPKLSTVQFIFKDVNPNVTFIVFQAHSHLYNIVMYNNTLGQNSSVTGTNVGLYSPVEGMYKLYVMNPNELDLKVLTAVHGYFAQDPVPGGCNMEMGVSIAPYMKAEVSPNKDYIHFLGAAPNAEQDAVCSYSKAVLLDFYRIYLPEWDFSAETYFGGIRAMMDLKSIMKIGELIPRTSNVRLRRTVSAYPGTGSVVVAVATNMEAFNDSDAITFSYSHSVYVPIVTYACSPLVAYDCELLGDLFAKILCASLLFVGAFVCYMGHKFFKTEMFIFGMLSGVLVTYIVISLIAELDQSSLLGVSFLSGILFGFIWLTFWWFYGIPVFSVLLCTLNFGFLCACVLYNQMPGGLIMEEINFWTVFILVVLISSVTMVSATYPANILCCAVLGAYAAIYPLDYCLGSNLKYLIINAVRRATVEDFNLAVLSPPFQLYDAVLTLLWVMLAATGFLFQHYHNRGKPPFPPPPRNIRQQPEVYHYGTLGGTLRTSNIIRVPRVQITRPSNERTLLLA